MLNRSVIYACNLHLATNSVCFVGIHVTDKYGTTIPYRRFSSTGTLGYLSIYRMMIDASCLMSSSLIEMLFMYSLSTVFRTLNGMYL